MELGSTLQWITVLFGAVILTTIFITLRAWRAAKRSPFYFMRREAQKRMQTSAIATVSLIVVYMGLATYLQQATIIETTPRYALIQNAKPPRISLTETEAPEPVEATVVNASSLTRTSARADFGESADAVVTELLPVARELPAEFDQFEPTAALSAATELGTIDFSRRINDDYEAVDAQRLFEEGFFTIYATFSYDKMADGMEWAWVWRLDGEVIAGGNELWAYGDDGPGYIFLQPEEGFQAGSYNLQVWVNGELLTEGSFVITSSIAANQ